MASLADLSTCIDQQASSTPLSTKQDRKRKKAGTPGSESSEGDLSYLDLDTGRVQTTSHKDERVVLTVAEFDKMMKTLEKMQSKFSKLDKLDKLGDIEKCVRDMNANVCDLESRVIKTESATRELQQSASFISDQYDTIVKQATEKQETLKKHGDELDKLRKENSDLKQSIADIFQMNSELKSELTDVNAIICAILLFTNIPEETKVSNEGRRYEETEDVLCKFLADKLNIKGVKFERVHRVQTTNPRRDTPKPIVAKFSFYKDREMVRRSGYKLKGTNYGIHEQFPGEIERKRRELYPLVRHFKKNNQQA